MEPNKNTPRETLIATRGGVVIYKRAAFGAKPPRLIILNQGRSAARISYGEIGLPSYKTARAVAIGIAEELARD